MPAAAARAPSAGATTSIRCPTEISVSSRPWTSDRERPSGVIARPHPSTPPRSTTAGGVVFAGDWDRHVYAYDAANGRILWQTRLPTSAQGFPVTLPGEGQTVRGRARGHRRWKLVDAPRAGARAGDPSPQQRQRDAGLRAAWRRGDWHAIDAVSHFDLAICDC